MSAQTLQLMAIVAFSLSVGALALAVILWFTLKIQDVISFLTGRNMRKATESLSSSAGKTIYRRPSKTSAGVKPEGAGDGKLKIKRTPVEETVPLGSVGAPATELLDAETMPLAEGTALLGDDNGFTEGTMLLDDGGEVEGTVLLEEESRVNPDFVITQSIVFVHTKEVINLNLNKY